MTRVLRGLTAGILLMIFFGVTACGQQQPFSHATQTPTSFPTVLATLTTHPITHPTMQPTPSPSRTPEYTYAPDEGEPVYPLAKLRILSPGEGSRLTSPIQTDLSILLGVDNSIEIELLNMRGVLLVKKLLRFDTVDPTKRILIHPLLDFEIAGDEEPGRLVVKTYDKYNRLVALASCDLVLLSSGENAPKAGRVPYESFLLTQPAAGAYIQGGVVYISGYARPVSQSAIVLELIDENGVEVANRVLFLKADNSDIPTVFSTTIPYQVGQETPVRLIIRQTKGGIPVPAIVFSMLLSIR
ncbi:MAG: hypothetical protein JXR32_02040 [Anaerolineaceae bacterium]|nr:hypothetical protein [Anaerolineaceae bacterium]